MDSELKPTTEVGARLVSLAEEHAEAFAKTADEHDRDASFPFDNWDAMKASGYLAGCVPEEFGGLGVTSIHDIMLATSRMGRGDASIAIGSNMHMTVAWGVARTLAEAREKGDEGVAAPLSMFLGGLGSSRVIVAGAGAETGGIGWNMQTKATPVDGGYVINGVKSFGTNSPGATFISTMVRFPSDNGDPDRMGMAFLMKGTEGMVIQDDWDSLGMRASGSNSIAFKDAFVPQNMVRIGPPIGQTNNDGPMGVGFIGTTFPLAGTYLGIAEAAREVAVNTALTRKRPGDGRVPASRHSVQEQIAEVEICLGIMRATLHRTALNMDEYLSRTKDSELNSVEVTRLMKDFQCTNVAVKRSAIEVVDRAMNVVGGSSYMRKNPLSRHWRDVRSGPFMQPFSPLEAFEYIGKVTLGIVPPLDS